MTDISSPFQTVQEVGSVDGFPAVEQPKSALSVSPSIVPPVRVSAVISAYESEKFMKGCLEDLVEQTLFKKGELEVIVVDSASPQNEGAIVRDFQRQHGDRLIRYIRTEKRETIYRAWNRGIRTSCGLYVTNANTDDRHRSDALEIMANTLDENPDVALVYGDVFVTHFPCQTFGHHIRSGYHRRPEYAPEIMLSGCHMGPQPMWRRSVHDDAGYFSDTLRSAGDYEFWCRIALRYPMRHIPEFLGLYYENPSGICNADPALGRHETELVQRMYAGRFPSPFRRYEDNHVYTGPVAPDRYVNVSMVTFNRLSYTRQAIESLVSMTAFPHVITVVDNGSGDGTPEYLCGLREGGIIRNLILMKRNIGVAKAANIAWLLEPEATFYLKYDNDIVIRKPSWLNDMVQVAGSLPDAGAVAYNFEPKSYPLTVLGDGVRVRVKRNESLGGACILIPKRTEKLVGHWNEEYGLYGEEDADYGHRILAAGLLNVYMEDENAGIHLPLGKAAAIDPGTLAAYDAGELAHETEYRLWKDDQRRKNVAGTGLFRENLAAYRSGKKPPFLLSSFAAEFCMQRSPDHTVIHDIPDPEPLTFPVAEHVPEKRKLKIGLLSPEPDGYACTCIRVASPLGYLTETGKAERVSAGTPANNGFTIDTEGIKKADLLVVQRHMPFILPHDKLLTFLPQNRPKIVYEIDDALTELPESHPQADIYRNMKPSIEEFLRKADLVTVSTETLKELYSPYSRNITVLPNVIDRKIWPEPPVIVKKGNTTRILFSGTPTHADDLTLVEDAIGRIAVEFPDTVEFLFWGDGTGRLARIPGVRKLRGFTPEYAEYAAFLRATDADFAIVPLKDNPFNRAKSHIKWLEYSACLIPGIYSAVGEYVRSIEHRKTGYLTGNTPDEWYRAIREMIRNSSLRESIARSAYREVTEKHTIERASGRRLEAYESLFRPGQTIAPKVSVIIPVFNKLEFTKKCLAALFANTPRGIYELIVVDNASSDGTGEYLKSLGLDVTVITNQANTGFAAACNAGAEKASGEYLLFLNNDTEPRPGWLEPLAVILDNDPSAGAAGSRLLFPDGTIQHAGIAAIEDRKIGDPLVARHVHYRKPSDYPPANRPMEYQALTAACLLVRKSAFMQAGGFDTGYWNGYEDVDLCFTMQGNGWTLVYEPSSVVIHHESASGTERFSAVRENIERLHKRWLGKISPDLLIDESGLITMTGANRMREYVRRTAGEGTARIQIEPDGEGPPVSIVILTLNQLDHTKRCLESIRRHTLPPYEIIVVDNASSDGTIEYLRSETETHDDIRVIANDSNRGFAAGNNQGISIASGKYIVLLNNDTIVPEGWISRMLSVFSRFPKTGITGPMSNSVSGAQFVQDFSFSSVTHISNFAGQWAEKHAEETMPAVRVVGFCLMAKRDVFARIGGLDEQFGSGNFEDDDFCIRAAYAGFGARIAGDVFVYHAGSATFRGEKMDYSRSLMKNWELFRKKWNIPEETPYTKGYRLPLTLAAGCSMYAPLPHLLFDHLPSENGRWWREVTPKTVSSEGKEGILSVIVVAEGPREQTIRSLEAIVSSATAECEIIIVPFGSEREFSRHMLSHLPEKPHSSPLNAEISAGETATGFHRQIAVTEPYEGSSLTGAFNAGILRSSGCYLALLDDSVIMTGGWEQEIRFLLGKSSRSGIVSPLFSDMKEERKPGMKNRESDAVLREFNERNRGRSAHVRIPPGRCICFTRSLAGKIGLFDERFSLFDFADDDYAVRADMAGYENLIAAGVRVRVESRTNEEYPQRIGEERRLFSEKWSGLHPSSSEGKRFVIANILWNARDLCLQDQSGAAIRMLEQLSSGFPGEKEPVLLHAEILIGNKQFYEAVALLSGLQSASAENFTVRNLLAYAQEGAGNNIDSERLAASLEQTHGDNAAVLNLCGIIALRKGHTEQAKEYFRKAISRDRGFGPPCANLGVIGWSENRQEDAYLSIRQGFVLSPLVQDILLVFFNASTSLSRMNDLEVSLREAADLYPRSKKINFALIETLISQGKNREAVTAVGKSMRQFGMSDVLLQKAQKLRKITGPDTIRKDRKKKGTLSLCMIVRNEGPFIAGCLLNIQPLVDEMIVVDTGSSDRTREIAEALGAAVFDFPWNNNFSDARNFSLSKAAGSWVFILDADEIFSPSDFGELRNSIRENEGKKIAFSFVTRNYVKSVNTIGWHPLDGKYPNEEAGTGWIRSEKVRLFPRDPRIVFTNPVHEIVEPSLNRIGFAIRQSSLPVHHYGKLGKKRVQAKGEDYLAIGRAKLEERGMNDIPALMELAVQAGELRRYEEALGYWERVLDLNPALPRALFGVGQAHLRMKRHEEARASFRRTFEVDRDFKEAYVQYALCSLCLGNTEDVMQALDRLLVRNPSYPMGVAMKTAAAFCAGKTEEGEKLLRRLREMNFGFVNYFRDLATALMGGKQYLFAERIFVMLVSVAGDTSGELKDMIERCRTAQKENL